MKRIQAIEMNRDEFIKMLQTLTDSGKLMNAEENWEEAINFAISIEDIMDEKEIKEKIAEYLGINEIRYYIHEGSTIILVYNAERKL